jgi:adenylate kinase
VINILGLAGSGKSTQGKLLADKLGCEWESSGDLHRKKLKGKERQNMLDGKIITDEVTIKLLAEEFQHMKAGSREFVFDGFPRSVGQARWLAAEVKAGNIMMTAVVHLVAHDYVARERLLHRGRKDDTESAIERRFADYQKTILPIISYLKSQNMPVFEVNADGTIEEVSRQINEYLGIK